MFQHAAVLSHRHCASPRALLSLLKDSFSPFISIVKDILSVEEALQCGQPSPGVPCATGGLGLGPGTVWGRAEVGETMEGGVASSVSEPWGQNNLKIHLAQPGEGPPLREHLEQPPRFSLAYFQQVLGRPYLRGNLGCVGWKQTSNITEIFW